MKGQLNRKDINNIREHYGVDIIDEIASILSDELSKSIDAEIIKNLSNNEKQEKINRIIEKINKFNEQPR